MRSATTNNFLRLGILSAKKQQACQLHENSLQRGNVFYGLRDVTHEKHHRHHKTNLLKTLKTEEWPIIRTIRIIFSFSKPYFAMILAVDREIQNYFIIRSIMPGAGYGSLFSSRKSLVKLGRLRYLEFLIIQ